MRKVDSDRIQSFHMQALRRILGIRWYAIWYQGYEMNEKNEWTDFDAIWYKSSTGHRREMVNFRDQEVKGRAGSESYKLTRDPTQPVN